MHPFPYSLRGASEGYQCLGNSPLAFPLLKLDSPKASPYMRIIPSKLAGLPVSADAKVAQPAGQIPIESGDTIFKAPTPIPGGQFFDLLGYAGLRSLGQGDFYLTRRNVEFQGKSKKVTFFWFRHRTFAVINSQT